MRKNEMFFVNFYLALLIIFISISIINCSGALEVQSTAQKNPLKIDGFDDDWDIPPKILRGQQISYRISNDDKFIYLCFTTNDRETVLQIFSLGLTVWFDKSGKDNEIFGVHYPMGMEGKGYPVKNPRGDRNDNRESSDRLFNELMESLKKIEIISPEKDKPETMNVTQIKGIEVNIGNLNSSLIYELKVPLKKTQDFEYAINSDTVLSLGIGFQTGKFDPNIIKSGDMNKDTPSGGDNSGGGRRGGGRSGSGSGGVRPAQGGNILPKNVEFWMNVKLAK
jgi:hypothetical protein